MNEKVSEKTVLQPEVLAQIERLGQADIIDGIPSFRNAGPISHVVRAAALGMVQFFPELKPVMVNADGGSDDSTRDVVLETPVPPQVEKIVTTYLGPAGKGSAFQTIFEIADRLRTKVCIVVDSDLRSITPEWIKLLGEPIYRYNYGFVTPHYLRYKYDGTITNSIAYPLTRALYGQRSRQPIGGDFGVCWALSKVFSRENILSDDNIHRFGIDIWMTTTAINEGFRVCQSTMGVKLHDPKDPGADLGPMFRQVVGTIFELMGKYETKWKVVHGSFPTDIFGTLKRAEPEQFAIDLHRLIENFMNGFAKNESLLERILPAGTFNEVKALTLPPTDIFNFPDELWVKAVYDFAVAYNWSGIDRRDIVDALMPLYFGRTGSFVIETEVMNNLQAEDEVEGIAETFERLKPYLLERWDAAKAQAAKYRVPLESRADTELI